MPRIARITVQRWRSDLALRIPAPIARSARLAAGQPVELSVEDSGLVVRPAGSTLLSLEQKLARFDPSLHGGEAIAATTIGEERAPN